MKNALLFAVLVILAGCSSMPNFSASSCTAEKGKMHGMNGKSYEGQCAGNEAAEIAWKKAYKRYEMKNLTLDRNSKKPF